MIDGLVNDAPRDISNRAGFFKVVKTVGSASRRLGNVAYCSTDFSTSLSSALCSLAMRGYHPHNYNNDLDVRMLCQPRLLFRASGSNFVESVLYSLPEGGFLLLLGPGILAENSWKNMSTCLSPPLVHSP